MRLAFYHFTGASLNICTYCGGDCQFVCLFCMYATNYTFHAHTCTATLQVLSLGESLSNAIEAQRLHHQLMPNHVSVEGVSVCVCMCECVRVHVCECVCACVVCMCVCACVSV